MELEVVRSVAAALADPDHGVSAMLAGVPRDAGDAVPPPVAIYDTTRHNWVTWDEIDLDALDVQLPAVAVGLYKPAPIDGEIQTIYRDGTFDVLIQYLAARDQSAAATQDGLYSMRAALRTLAWFHHPDQAARRTRNGVVLRVCKQIGQAPMYAVRKHVVVTAALLVTYTVRDTQPFAP